MDNRTKTSDATFAGQLSFLRRKYSMDVDKADAVVWGIPFDAATSNRPGTRFGPQAIRRAVAGFDNDPQYPFDSTLYEDMEIVDYGDCKFDYGMPNTIPNDIYTQAKNIIETPNSPYLLSLGGDHYVTYPILKAHYDKFGPMALVQFDAHQDTWDDEGDRVDHGTLVKRAVDEGLIVAEQSIQIGIRTVAPDTCGIKIIDALQANEMKSQEIADEIVKHTKGQKVYLTFDIDCLDPAFAPGTGTPVSGGLSSGHALAVLNRLRGLEIVGSDVVEVSPPYDHSDITAIAGGTVAVYMLGLLHNRKFK